MTEEHRKIITDKCSNEENPKMPNVPTSASLLVTAGAAKCNKASAITPPPGHSQMVAENQSNVVVGMARGGKGKGGKKKAPKGGVTPEPPNGTADKAAAAASKKPAAKKPPSKTTLEAHKKWQAEAEKRGGPNARIIVSKKDAKKPVFDKLMDSFKPMNITDL